MNSGIGMRLVATIAVALGAACPPAVEVEVALAPQTATVVAGETQQFSVAVLGAEDTSVTWSLSDAAAGSIDAEGRFSATTPGSYQVIATSVEDPDVSAAATVTVVPEPVEVSVSPSGTTAYVGGAVQFTAAVTGTDNTSVSWSIVEGAAGGTISDTGLYTAPDGTGTFHVVATSAADSTATAEAVVTVLSEPVEVSVSPGGTTAYAGEVVQFAATVSGHPNKAVLWSIAEGAAGGTISAAGLYTAPLAAGTYHVVATSAVDSTATAEAVVTVLPHEVEVSVSPAGATAYVGDVVQLAATVTGTDNTAVIWTVTEGSAGGSVTTTGLYTAPGAVGTFHVVATSAADPSASGEAVIAVLANPVAISPPNATMEAGLTAQFSATVTGMANTAVTWTVLESGGGTIDESGFYRSPATPGEYHVIATSVGDPSRSASALVTVATPSPILGTGTIHHVVGDTVFDVPRDFTTVPIAALVRDASGNFTEYQATTFANGTFRIEGVPHGPYLLRIRQNSYWQRTLRAVDLSQFALGRPDLVEESSGTALQFALDGLAPWTEDSSLQITSDGATLTGSTFAARFDAPLDSTVLSKTLDYKTHTNPRGGGLIVPSDIITIQQRSPLPLTSGVTAASAVTHALTTSGFMLEDATTTTLTGTLAALPTQQLNVNFSRRLFTDAANLAHPEILFEPHSLYIAAASAPDGIIREIAGEPSLLSVEMPETSTSGVPMSYSFGNPFDSSRRLLLRAYTNYGKYYQLELPSGELASPTSLAGSIGVAIPLEEIGPNLTPVISPPQDVRVDGQPAHEPIAISATPVVAWDPPALGSATAYTVMIYRLSVSGTNTRNTLVGTVSTSDVSVAIPPAFLSPGYKYVLTIYAWDIEGYAEGSPDPLRHARGVAQALTEILTVD